jgi:formylglycine-generating enzyme required for sulfatase activity
MVWIPGGQFWMGSDDSHMPDTKPWHRVYVDGYWIDRTEVTNEQFARFVTATGYVTVAERKPRAEDYPAAPPENLIAGSAGANWRHPEGPASDIQNRMSHPVVHIAALLTVDIPSTWIWQRRTFEARRDCPADSKSLGTAIRDVL